MYRGTYAVPPRGNVARGIAACRIANTGVGGVDKFGGGGSGGGGSSHTRPRAATLARAKVVESSTTYNPAQTGGVRVGREDHLRAQTHTRLYGARTASAVRTTYPPTSRLALHISCAFVASEVLQLNRERCLPNCSLMHSYALSTRVRTQARCAKAGHPVASSSEKRGT
eukprot:1576718-Pleurochrysis_carterae.AAC.1